MFITVTLGGTVIRKQLNESNNGTKILNLRLSCQSYNSDKRQKDSFIFEVTVFGKQAESLDQYIQAADKQNNIKGTKLVVVGDYQGESANESNGTTYINKKIKAYNISFVGGGNGNNGNGNNKSAASSQMFDEDEKKGSNNSDAKEVKNESSNEELDDIPF